MVTSIANYRGLINMLVFCGCVGQSGGGWAHYVGREKNRARKPAGSRWRLPLTGSVRRVT
ncbi:molybdopterin-dependent oxidoreductase [Salmonella enterica subsp. enterica]|nr:molybdopterin-dependent oxidoreductase [Salmonella enterica subsp. enterica]